jgi:hypothetical protein
MLYGLASTLPNPYSGRTECNYSPGNRERLIVCCKRTPARPHAMSNQKKLRDLERLLKKKQAKGDDDCESLVKKIDELKEVKEEVKFQERKKKNAVKYHMIKFIERKKLTRSIRSLESGDKAEDKKTKKRLQQLREDLAYVMYYPSEHKYVALFADESLAEGGAGSAEAKTTNKLGEQARAEALKLWQQDLARGVKDKVAHAMEVEYNGGKNNNNNSSSSSNSKKVGKVALGVDDDDNEVFGDDDEEAVAAPSSSGSGSRSGAGAGAGAPAAGKSHKRNFDDVGDDYGDKQDDSNSKKKKKDKKDRDSVRPAAAAAAVVEEYNEGDVDDGDAFFVEEVGANDDTSAGQGEGGELQNIKAVLGAHGGKWSERHKQKRTFKNDRRVNRR